MDAAPCSCNRTAPKNSDFPRPKLIIANNDVSVYCWFCFKEMSNSNYATSAKVHADNLETRTGRALSCSTAGLELGVALEENTDSSSR